MLVVIAPATAALSPIQREFGERSVPRVGKPDARAQKAPGADRVRVVLRLRGQPLAKWQSRRLEARGAESERRLDLREPAARRYLRTLEARQTRAIAAVREAVPSATVEQQFRILLNAVTVEAPVEALATLASLSSVTRVYPSLRYTSTLNTSPGVVGATPFSNATGAFGTGTKIAIVDDGVDPANPFFDPAGFSYPDGFPKGNRSFTTEKVIVARSFAPPGAPARSRRPVDRNATFHGTHVAGIAAGAAGKTAPKGLDHPETPGLSGVAPNAWIGNYRVFNIPTPIGDVANTPEIVAAFERAVTDGMDVINFSGGGPEVEPANDALIEAIENIAAAGVVAVVAAGNDRDDFGTGSIGSPSTAPAAISVAAVSNRHLFAPPLVVEGFGEIPYQPGAGGFAPNAWAKNPRPIVDVRTVAGTDGNPVDEYLCAPGNDPNAPKSTLPPGSLKGAVALASRGICTFVSKAERAAQAGAVGLVLIDNRSGEANAIPIPLEIPGFMISDLDGANLRAHLASGDGTGSMLARQQFVEFDSGRSGVVTSFSSGGPTALEHALKPDVAAPGGSVLSSTMPEIADSPYAVFDGTSMATPHVAGAAALLLERHPSWLPAQVKSALMSTARPAWGDSARAAEASVLLQGAGLVDLGRADNPLVFAVPSSLSFGDLNVNTGAASEKLALEVSDAGGGAGSWTVEVRPQASTSGAWLDLPKQLDIPNGGDALFSVTARAAAGAIAGENHGFIVLRREGEERRVPYAFLVTRPGLQFAEGKALQRFQVGNTKRGSSRASVYRYPSAPFGPSPEFGSTAVEQTGAEDIYVFNLDHPAINFGVAVETEADGARIDPFVLGSPDENDVQGFAAIPVDINALNDTYLIPNGAAGLSFPRPGRYYVSVDSGLDTFTGSPRAGRYVLRAWVDDLEPPSIELLTKRVSGQQPLIAARITDRGAGVDPLSMEIVFDGIAVGAAAYDPIEGLALFPLPSSDSALKQGRNSVLILASDYQESKNVQTIGSDIFPNTGVARARLRYTPNNPAVSWLSPVGSECVAKPRDRLVVTADGPNEIVSVRFLDGSGQIGIDRKSEADVFSAVWRSGRKPRGTHTLTAIATDENGNEVSARLKVRVCR